MRVGGKAAAFADSTCFSVALRTSRMERRVYSKVCQRTEYLDVESTPKTCVPCPPEKGECPEPRLSGTLVRCTHV